MSELTETRGLRGTVSVLASPAEVASDAASRIIDLSSFAIAAHGAFDIVLTGGTTPRLLYETLTHAPLCDRVGWPSWRVYFSDERAVPPDDPESNYRTARESLLDQVPIESQRVHRMRGEALDLDAAADEYSRLLEDTLPSAATGAPRLDCILLGLGENGHVASLFPGTPALDVVDRWAARGLADYAPFDRITLTFATINAAANVMVLVTGPQKADAVLRTAQGLTPASRLLPVDGRLHWLIDHTAASRLT